jgi:hypothetical protein
MKSGGVLAAKIIDTDRQQRGTIRKSYGYVFSVVYQAWADRDWCFYVEAED